MSGDEILMFMGFLFMAVWFLIRWYRPILKAWTGGRRLVVKLVLSCLPALSYVMILYTLRVLASFDVVEDGVYVVFYLAFGFAWSSAGMWLTTRCLNISWRDDALLGGNLASLCAVAGAFLGLTCIFSGANVGDGPGWWCVLFAGGLGLAAWFALAFLFHLCTGVIERVTVDRDVGCGVRFGCYLLASGLLLGRASAGDWTSFADTVMEFADGWPVLPLTLLALFVEWFCQRSVDKPLGEFARPDASDRKRRAYITGSVAWGAALMAAAVCAVLLLPKPKENPIYNDAWETYASSESDRWAP